MVNMFKMIKQAASMQKEMKQIQKELAGHTVEGRSGGGLIKVVARGDMSVESITIDPKAVDPAQTDKLERLLLSAVNDALSAAKKEAGGAMSKLTEGLGMGDLLSGL